jgi:hypothetical protein
MIYSQRYPATSRLLHSIVRGSLGNSLDQAVWQYANHVLLSTRNVSESRQGQVEACMVGHTALEPEEEVTFQKLVR